MFMVTFYDLLIRWTLGVEEECHIVNRFLDKLGQTSGYKTGHNLGVQADYVYFLYSFLLLDVLSRVGR